MATGDRGQIGILESPADTATRQLGTTIIEVPSSTTTPPTPSAGNINAHAEWVVVCGSDGTRCEAAGGAASATAKGLVVHVATSALPAGAATAAKQDAAQARLDVLATDRTSAASPFAVRLSDGSSFLGVALDATSGAIRDRLPSALAASGALKASIVDALPSGANTLGKLDQGAPGAAAWPVSAASLPLPAGASTAAKQDTAQARLDLLATDRTTAGAPFAVRLSDGAAFLGVALDATSQAVRDRLPASFAPGGGVKVGLVDAIPAGANTIGKVDQGTAGAQAWPVSVASLPLPSGASTEATLLDVKRGITGYLKRLDYGARLDGQPVYLGRAPQGTADGASNAWVVSKYDYDATNRLTRVQEIVGDWTNRAALSWMA